MQDLDTAAGWLRQEHGLDSVEGGHHEAWGTVNRIVPLGDSYLELIAVADPSLATKSVLAHAVLDQLTGREGLVGWVVATDDLETVANRLALDVLRGTRLRPDGVELSWRLAGIDRALTTGALPFFIQWEGSPELHPSRAPAAHRVTPTGISWLEVSADAGALEAWLGANDLPLRVTDGPPSLAAVAIGAGPEEIVLR